MKKQNANKLVFAKKAVLELNNEELNKIIGGTGLNPYQTNPLGCTFCVASSNGPGTIHDYYQMYNILD